MNAIQAIVLGLKRSNLASVLRKTIKIITVQSGKIFNEIFNSMKGHKL